MHYKENLLQRFSVHFRPSAELLVTLAADAEVVGSGGGSLAATVDELHHYAVVLLVLQVEKIGRKHFERGGFFQQFLIFGWRPKELHHKASGCVSIYAIVARQAPAYSGIAAFCGAGVNLRLYCGLCSDRERRVILMPMS